VPDCKCLGSDPFILRAVESLHVQVVIGPSSRVAFESIILPSLTAAFSGRLYVHLLDYSGAFEEGSSIHSENLVVNEYRSEFEHGNGFGANHNFLFEKHKGEGPFLLLNPDAYPAPDSFNSLLSKFSGRRDIAIVEGRQWPFAHPKEYDQVTFETPWASGAFCAISRDFFKSVGGFDTRYEMYLEDVDLSWTAWEKGWKVLHNPKASCFHFSGGYFYRRDLESLEERMGKVNFVKLLEKFFGDEGLTQALKLLSEEFGEEQAVRVIEDAGFNESRVKENLSPHLRKFWRRRLPHHIKVLGYNRFHRFQDEIGLGR
jgi:hypothetical protein